MTREEILRVLQRDRLEDLLDGWYMNTYKDVMDVADHLLENGIIVAPCKIGTKLYMIVTKRSKVCLPPFSFIKVTKLTYCNLERVIEDFGITVFLTRAEAEAKMKEMQDDR